MSEERCKHELITSQCADCRPHTHSKGRYRTVTDPPRIHSIEARYTGECEACLDPIKPEQLIAFWVEAKRWLHTDCLMRELE